MAASSWGSSWGTSWATSWNRAVSVRPSVGPGSGYGSWARRKLRRGGQEGRIRLLSELDATATASAGEALTDQTFNVDAKTAEAIERQVMEAFADVADKAARIALQRRRYDELMARERELADDDETFLLM